jgi:hypothetical protein
LNPRGLSTTDLAGLPPTRLGQSRQILPQPRRFLRVFKAVSACSLILCYLVYLSFPKKDTVRACSHVENVGAETGLFVILREFAFCFLVILLVILVLPTLACLLHECCEVMNFD